MIEKLLLINSGSLTRLRQLYDERKQQLYDYHSIDAYLMREVVWNNNWIVEYYYQIKKKQNQFNVL